MMYPKEEIIRLTGEPLRRLNMQVWDRDEECCVVCGRWVPDGTKMHHEPLKSNKGQDREQDMFCLCLDCHHERHFGKRCEEIEKKVLAVRGRLYGIYKDAKDTDATGGRDREPAGDHETTGADPERDSVSNCAEDVDGRRCDDGGCSSPQDAGQSTVRVPNDIKDQGTSGVKGAAERRHSGSRRSTTKARTTFKADKSTTNGLRDSIRGSAKDRKHHAGGDAEPTKVRRKRGCWVM